MVKPDKRTSNFVIACGYALVAVIILFNYLGKDLFPQKGALPPAKLPVISRTNTAPGLEMLSRQLSEEKQINSEMRELLRNMQTAMGDSDHQNGRFQTSPPQNSSMKLEFPAIPDIRPDIFTELNKPRSNPFSPGKNPFFSSSDKVSKARQVFVEGNLARSLKCHPKLPFLISGANKKNSFMANY